jgi:hypothetical protein
MCNTTQEDAAMKALGETLLHVSRQVEELEHLVVEKPRIPEPLAIKIKQTQQPAPPPC